MLNLQIVQILNSILGKSYKYTSENYLFYCPSCHYSTQKLSINVQTDSLSYGKYHCWVCGFKGSNLYQLLHFLKIDSNSSKYSKLQAVYSGKPVKIYKKKNDNINIQLPQSFQPILPMNKEDILKIRAIRYLFNRNITAQDMIKYDIGICRQGKYAGRIVIPSYDKDFNLNYFVTRSINPLENMRYLNPVWSKDIIFNQHLLNFQYPIVLCQGVFDAIAFKRNSIPLLGKNIPQKLLLKLVQYKPNVYVCLDADALNETYKLCNSLNNLGITTFTVKLKQKDPGSLSLQKLQQYIKNSNQYQKYQKQDFLKHKLLNVQKRI